MLFGGGGVIAENLRDEQRKIIKYNHLIANLLIFHNLVTLDRALAKLRTDGHAINDAAVDDLSPYQTEHLNRFGTYPVNMDRMSEPLNLELP